MQNLKEIQHLFQEYLTQNPFRRPPVELYEPVDYILSLGGKRLRPAFLLLSYQLFKPDLEKALPAAMAIEVFHNFSLVHDDIMDAAPLRRGKTTVHHRYGLNAGILSGDVMLIYCYDYLLRLENKANIASIIETFNRLAIEVCEGQQFDINFENRNDVSIPEYLKMIELKTAALIGGSLAIGGLVAGTSAENVAHLNQFGRKIGIAFQLQDDILDTFGDPEKFGKKVGGDIAQNKKTFLILKAMEIADSDSLAKLQHYMASTSFNEREKIDAVTNILQKLQIRDLAEQLKNDYQRQAFAHLDAVQVAPEQKKGLHDLASMLLVREH